MFQLNGEEIKSYGYTDTNWKDKLTSFNGETITYDNIGNPLTYRDGFSFSWANGRQLTDVAKDDNNISYAYNADGLRASKTVNGTVTDYYWLDGMLLGEKTGDNVITYLYDENGTIYGFVYNNTNFYYSFNAQGDVVALIDITGSIVARYFYDAWGNLLFVTNNAGTDISDIRSHVANINTIRYRGYYYDSETGFYYLQSRYYDPITHRFLNADGLVSTGQGILGTNMFAYCGNNPVMMADPSGQFWELVVGAVLVIGLVVSLAGCSEPKPEPEPPTDYTQEDSSNKNCYSYAFDLPFCGNPGDYSGNRSTDNYMYENTSIHTSEEITEFVLRDMVALNKSVRVVNSPTDVLENEYIVAMKTSTNILKSVGVADYHFAIQLSDGTWADKPGGFPSRWNKIDGSALAWDCGYYHNYYNTESVYFAVEK